MISTIDTQVKIFQERLNSWLIAPKGEKSYKHIWHISGILQGLEIAKQYLNQKGE